MWCANSMAVILWATGSGVYAPYMRGRMIVEMARGSERRTEDRLYTSICIR
jgi:hypothetical protein